MSIRENIKTFVLMTLQLHKIDGLGSIVAHFVHNYWHAYSSISNDRHRGRAAIGTDRAGWR
jgi:hypothetical protein